MQQYLAVLLRKFPDSRAPRFLSLSTAALLLLYLCVRAAAASGLQAARACLVHEIWARQSMWDPECTARRYTYDSWDAVTSPMYNELLIY